MKKIKNMVCFPARDMFAILLVLTLSSSYAVAQDSVAAPAALKSKPVKNTFGSVWLIDNQTVMVPVKGTLELDIQHRFGTVKNGSEDLWGFFAPSNIRLGIGYAPVKKLFLGIGITKERMQVDLNAKYQLMHQTTDNKIPVSISVFGNMAVDSRNKSNFRFGVHRLSYFSQVIIARKVTENFSVQAAPSFSWFNNVEAYVDKNGDIQKKMKNGHLAISVLGRYKVSPRSSIIAGYDQPLTEHTTNNPHPNICFGFETNTSSHAFQVFAGNYYYILPQSNNVFNQNNYRKGAFLIGFNITRLWNY